MLPDVVDLRGNGIFSKQQVLERLGELLKSGLACELDERAKVGTLQDVITLFPGHRERLVEMETRVREEKLNRIATAVSEKGSEAGTAATATGTTTTEKGSEASRAAAATATSTTTTAATAANITGTAAATTNTTTTTEKGSEASRAAAATATSTTITAATAANITGTAAATTNTTTTATAADSPPSAPSTTTTPSPSSTPPPPTTPTLPYPLQHAILPPLQSFLECACHRYLSTHHPHILREKCWSTPSAAELHVYTHKIPAIRNDIAALKSINEIRHVAVHRIPLTEAKMYELIDVAEAAVGMLENAETVVKVRELRGVVGAWLDRRKKGEEEEVKDRTRLEFLEMKKREVEEEMARLESKVGRRRKEVRKVVCGLKMEVEGLLCTQDDGEESDDEADVVSTRPPDWRILRGSEERPVLLLPERERRPYRTS